MTSADSAIVDHVKPHRWRVLVRVFLFFILCTGMVAAISPMTRRLSGPWPLVFLGTATSIGTFAFTFFFVRWEGLRLVDVGALPQRGSMRRFALGFLAGLLLVALSASIQTVAGHLQWVRTPANGLRESMIALLGFIVLACREELAFRGYPLRCLERSFGLWSALIFVAGVFALEHRLGGWPWERALLGAGLGGLVFGMAAIATKGLALPIGMHAAFNFGDSMIGQNYAPGFWSIVIEKGQDERVQQLITVSYIIVMGLAFLIFWLWHRKVNREGN